MHDSGLLGQMLPEFKAINCRVVRDFYHKYTVDEHTLLTIRNLERLIDAPARSASASARLLGELDAPELLVLALLLPRRRQMDATKTTPPRARGWRAQMFERLDLDEEARERRRVPRRRAPEDVARRRSGATPRIRRSSGSSPSSSASKSG